MAYPDDIISSRITLIVAVYRRMPIAPFYGLINEKSFSDSNDNNIYVLIREAKEYEMEECRKLIK